MIRVLEEADHTRVQVVSHETEGDDLETGNDYVHYGIHYNNS